MRGSGDQDLAAEMAAFLFRRQLIFKVNAGCARFNIGFHDLVGIERTTETSLSISNNRQEPIAFRAAFRMFDFIGALQSAVDPTAEFRARICGIERLIRIHRTRRIGVCCHLPAGEINRLQTGASHLHRLVTGHRAERVDVILTLQQFPELVGAALGERLCNRKRAAQTDDFINRIRALDAIETAFGCIRHKGFKCLRGHKGRPFLFSLYLHKSLQGLIRKSYRADITALTLEMTDRHALCAAPDGHLPSKVTWL